MKFKLFNIILIIESGEIPLYKVFAGHSSSSVWPLTTEAKRLKILTLRWFKSPANFNFNLGF
jgi:hypothetical protein